MTTTATMPAVEFDDHGMAIMPNGTVTIATEPGGYLVSSEGHGLDWADFDMAFGWIAAQDGRVTAAWADGPVDLIRVVLP